MISPKILALRDVAMVFVGAILGGLLINYLQSEFTLAQIATGLAIIALGACIRTLYQLRVGQYEYQQKLNKTVDKLHE